MPWRLIDGPESADAVAREIARAPYRRAPRTSIYGALQFAKPLFDASGYRGHRQVIDVSGDGVNNMGPPVTQMRDEVLAAGITINGLPIMLRRQTGYGMWGMAFEQLDVYYEDCVIGGPGSFVIAHQGARPVQGGDPHQAGDGGRGRDAAVARGAGAGQEAAGVLLVSLCVRGEKNAPAEAGVRMRPARAVACIAMRSMFGVAVLGFRWNRHAVVHLLRGCYPHLGQIEELLAYLFGRSEAGGLETFIGVLPILD